MKLANLCYSALAFSLAMTACKKENDQESTREKVPGFDISSLDSTVKACDDFDTYVNGGWKKANPIPGTESRWGAFNVLDKENLMQMPALFNQVALISLGFGLLLLIFWKPVKGWMGGIS